MAAVKRMLFVTSGEPSPDPVVIGFYWKACEDLETAAVMAKIEELSIKSEGHIAPGALRRHITGQGAYGDDASQRQAALVELSKPEWQRRGFISADAWDKHCHELWLKTQGDPG